MNILLSKVFIPRSFLIICCVSSPGERGISSFVIFQFPVPAADSWWLACQSHTSMIKRQRSNIALVYKYVARPNVLIIAEISTECEVSIFWFVHSWSGVKMVKAVAKSTVEKPPNGETTQLCPDNMEDETTVENTEEVVVECKGERRRRSPRTCVFICLLILVLLVGFLVVYAIEKSNRWVFIL